MKISKSAVRLATMAVLLGLILTLVPTDHCAAMPPSEQLFPKTTSGYFSITNVNTLREQWLKTQIGQLMSDKVMEPFVEDLSEQFNEKLTKLSRRVGLTWKDLTDVAAGEIAVGYTNMSQTSSAIMVLIDVTDRVPKATQLLDKVSETLIAEDAKRSTVSGPEGSETSIVCFELPPLKIPPRKNAQDEDASAEPVQYYVYYFITKDVLCCTDDLEAARMLVSRIEDLPTEEPIETLGDLEGYQTVMKRCADDSVQDTVPHLKWFLSPYEYFQAIFLGTPESRRPKGKSIADVIRHQGLDLIKGVGGTVGFSVEDLELVHRTYIYAPPPHKLALATLRFIDGVEKFGAKAFEPQPWVPRGVASYQTTYFDVEGAVKRFGPIFNEILGPPEYLDKIDLAVAEELDKKVVPADLVELADMLDVELKGDARVDIMRKGKRWRVIQALPAEDDVAKEAVFELRAGDDSIRVYWLPDIWKETLESLKGDGPMIDLVKDLAAHLGPRISVLSDYKVPVTQESNRMLIAIEVDDTEKVAETLAKLFQGDVTVRHLKYKDLDIWERHVDPEEAEELIDDPLDLPDGPDSDPIEDEEEEAQMSILPYRTMVVVDGQLLISSHLDYLQYVLQYQSLFKDGKLEPNKTLAEGSIDYTLVNTTITQMNLEKQVLRRFVRTDEAYRVSYELLREGRVPESSILLGRLFEATLTQETIESVREEKLNAERLPDFQIVRRYLGPSGMVVCDEENGWFIKGFVLTKK